MKNIALETRSKTWVNRNDLCVENVYQYLVDGLKAVNNPAVTKYDIDENIIWTIETEDNLLSEFVFKSENVVFSLMDFRDENDLGNERDEFVLLRKWIEYLFDNGFIS